MEPHNGLNNLDYIVIGITLLSGLLAMMRGFVRELFSLIAWVGAYFIAVKTYHAAIPSVQHYIKNDKAAEWAAIAGTYFIALILLIIIGTLIARLIIRGRTLTAIDRSLGFLYGVARGVLVLSLVYLGAVMVLWPDLDKSPAEQQQAADQPQDKDRNVPPDILLEAKTRPLLAYGAQEMRVFIPQDMIDKTLQNYAGQRKAAQKELDQKVLDQLSTPVPQPSPTTGNSNAPEHIDMGKIINQGSTP